jgi:exopolysaccharide biosynthesis operon protein EpsL
MSKSITSLLKILFVIPLAISPVSVSLAALDKFEPYVFTGVMYDSNLFRRSSNEESDTIWHVGAGFESDLKLSRQHLVLDIELDRSLYNTNDQLDNTSIDGRAAWQWEVGNLWSGNLGYDYDKRLNSYTETFDTEKDMRTTQTGFFDAGYQLHPDWRLVGGADVVDVSYDERTQLDRKVNSGLLEVQYQNTLNTRVGLRGRYSVNELNDTNIGGISISNDYDMTALSGVFYWEGSALSALELLLGYTDINYDETSDEIGDRDFDGVSGRLTYHWILTGKTKLDISAWREPSTLNDEIQDYVLAQGVSIRPIWKATTKITVRGEILYENDDFKARNDVLDSLGEQKRKDNNWLFSIRGNWEPRRNIDVSVGYRYKDRDSTIDVRDFKDNQVDARVQLTF